jgi:lysophospholipase L1-like esterase
MQGAIPRGDGKAPTATVTFARYVAIGDSTTEGLEDPSPDGLGYLGFADRLAARLARDQPSLLYANLGIRGRKMHRIRDEQLEPALALKPDLVSIVGGINDILRPRCDLAAVADHLEQMVAALSAGGATVLGMTFPDAARIMPAARPARGRILAFNANVRSVAARHRMLVADLERRGVVDQRLWSIDRLHANSAGHARIAAALAQALGLEPDEDPWAPLPPADPVPRRVALRREAAWIRRHMAPWLIRRARGVSSGDGRSAKRPRLTPVLPTGNAAAEPA